MIEILHNICKISIYCIIATTACSPIYFPSKAYISHQEILNNVPLDKEQKIFLSDTLIVIANEHKEFFWKVSAPSHNRNKSTYPFKSPSRDTIYNTSIQLVRSPLMINELDGEGNIKRSFVDLEELVFDTTLVYSSQNFANNILK